MNEYCWGQGRDEILDSRPVKVVDLSGLVGLSRATLAPVADRFDQQVSMFTGQTREGRLNNPERIRLEQRLRMTWKKEMDDLASFLAKIESNPRALMLMPKMCKLVNDGERGRKIKILDFISGDENLNRKRGTGKQFSVLVLELIIEEGNSPEEANRLGSDPAERLQRAEEISLIRIRAYTRKVNISAGGEVTKKSQIGIDVERVFRSDVGHLLMVHYCFPEHRNIKIHEATAAETPLFFNEAVECIEGIFEQRND